MKIPLLFFNATKQLCNQGSLTKNSKIHQATFYPKMKNSKLILTLCFFAFLACAKPTNNTSQNTADLTTSVNANLTKLEGEKCGDDNECLPTLFCGDSQLFRSRKCTLQLSIGDKCERSRQCQSMICDQMDGKCAASKRGLGSLCRNSSDCAGRLYCSNAGRNATGTAPPDTGICERRSLFGEECIVSEQCAQGLECFESLCVFSSSSQGPVLNIWALVALIIAALLFSLVVVPLAVCFIFSGSGCCGSCTGKPTTASGDLSMSNARSNTGASF